MRAEIEFSTGLPFPSSQLPVLSSKLNYCELIFNQLATNKERKKIKLGLNRIKACLDYLENPQEKFKSVIIGGTNGKGSVTFYLSNLACKYTNYKVGRYISPHLMSWNERFVINEKVIDNKKLNEITQIILEQINEFEKTYKNKLTLFEILTVIAFKYFEEENVDVAFLEVGMGGRLDATNIVPSKNTLCSVITNVSYDHMEFLGNTTEKIAFEKAGIIKENNYLITGVNGKALRVIENQVRELNAKIILPVQNLEEKETYLDKNIKLALTAWNIISKQIEIKKQRSKEAEKLFLENLQFPGRFQYFKNQKILLDGAHNPEAAYELRKLLDLKFKGKKIIYIIGILDKDYKLFIKNLVSKDSSVICTEPKSERATKKEELSKHAELLNLKTILCNNLQDAIDIAKKQEHDLIVITGSLYLVGETLTILNSGFWHKIITKGEQKCLHKLI